MIKVLLVDWDPERIALLRNALADEEWVLVDSGNDPDALSRARAEHPEAIVLMGEERRRNSFLTSKSFEIRTPLNAVIGISQLLLDTELSPQQLEYVKIIQNSGRQLLEVVAGPNDRSKSQPGAPPIESVEFSLRETLESVAELLAPHAQKKGLEVASLILSGMADSFVGDRERLRQILINLVNSAIKFTSRGEVVIGARQVSSEGADNGRCLIEFSVRDTGPGISDETMRSISETFAREDNPDPIVDSASDYGLTLCKHLVDRLHGTIAVESVARRGTTFRFRLPLRRARKTTRSSPAAFDELRRLRVLCVDDSPSCLTMLEQYLRGWGIDVQSARSGQHAMEQLLLPAAKEEAYGLVIADKVMPGMDGVELTRSIRNIPELAALPVILMTPLAFSGRESVLKPLGISGFLTKPIRRAQLLESILQVLCIETDPEGRSKEGAAKSTAAVRKRAIERKERILLVEDDPTSRKLAVAFLKNLGFRPVAASDGKDALNKLGSSPFDLVLMDCQMPEMDGFEATRLIREHERASGEHLPIIALTAHAMAEDRERCFSAGMDSYLTKPIVIDELAAEIDRLLVGSAEETPHGMKPAS